MSIPIMTLSLGWYGLVPQIDPLGTPGYDEVARTLRASGMLSDLREAPDAPEMGVYCHIDFNVRERSPWLTFYEGVNFVALIGSLGIFAPAVMVNALPYYAGEGGTTVVYTLYRDGRLTQTYRYPITKQGAGWVVLLPFAWLNFFTNDLKDAVRGTALQFLIDAQRDEICSRPARTMVPHRTQFLLLAALLIPTIVCAADFTGSIFGIMDGDAIEL